MVREGPYSPPAPTTDEKKPTSTDWELTPSAEAYPTSSMSQSLEGTLTCQCPGLQHTDKCKPSWLVRTSTTAETPDTITQGEGRHPILVWPYDCLTFQFTSITT